MDSGSRPVRNFLLRLIPLKSTYTRRGTSNPLPETICEESQTIVSITNTKSEYNIKYVYCFQQKYIFIIWQHKFTPLQSPGPCVCSSKPSCPAGTRSSGHVHTWSGNYSDRWGGNSPRWLLTARNDHSAGGKFNMYTHSFRTKGYLSTSQNEWLILKSGH